MSFSSRSRRWQERQKRQLLTTTIIGLIFLSAAVYLYGGQFRIHLLMNQGRALVQQGQLDQALDRFNRVLKLRGNYSQAIDAMGLVYLIQGDTVRAEIKYEQAVKLGLKSNRRFNHQKVGNSYLARGLYGPAELEFRHALDLTPRDPDAHLGHAYALHALGRMADAIDEYRKTLALDSSQKEAQIHLNQARQDLERRFMYYIYDRRHTPLARYSFLQKSAQRYYPLAQYASHLIGYASTQHGNAGLEGALASYLPGNSVTLTINADWQRAADRALRWHKGSLVALDPQTGEILVVANHPSYDPNQVDKDWAKIVHNKNLPLKNRGLEGLYAPGSIFKTITAAAALESKIGLDHIFPVQCAGGARYSGKTFWCWMRHNKVDSLQTALDTSCNIAMAEVGFSLGPDRLYDYATKFGFGSPWSFPFKSKLVSLAYPVATSAAPIVSDDQYQVAEYSCGLSDGMVISPLHAALLAATIANHGRMMAPYLIREIKNIRGEVLAEGESQLLRTPITPEVADQVKQYMIDTVRNGIGTRAQVAGLTVAGKTGTTGDSQHGGLNGWFICFAPAENPKVALAVYAEHEGTGMDVAAPIAKNFLQEIKSELQSGNSATDAGARAGGQTGVTHAHP